MAWLWLAIASVFEVMFALGAKAAHGFTRPAASAVTVVGAVGGVVALGLALRDLDLSVGYAVWTSIGAAGTAIGSAWLYREPMTWRKVLSILTIVAGVLGLVATGAS